MSALVRRKDFPEDYPSDAVAILKAMSFTGEPKLVGSMSLRSQQYAGDYDAVEVVDVDESTDAKALKKLARKFQSIIRDLKGMKDVYIGDIKSGVIEEWRVIPREAMIKDGRVVGYSGASAREKVKRLRREEVISPNEEKYALQLLTDTPSKEQFLMAKAELKYHIVRWSVDDVERGKKRLRDGRIYTLEEAFHSPTITKLDVIGLVANNRYTDFSIIYQFVNGGAILNPDKIDVEQSLKENIIAYRSKGDVFKVLKREFALAKYEGNLKRVAELSKVLNSDLGRLYQIVGDVGTLISLLEDHKSVALDKIRFEVDQFRGRLANIYSLKGYLKVEDRVLGEIDLALRSPNRELMLQRLRVLQKSLDRQLQTGTKEAV